MNTITQSRITVNGAVGPIMDGGGNDRWKQVAGFIAARGGTARLENRIVCDDDVLPCLADPTGWIKLGGGRVVSPWEIKAELDE